MPPRHLADGGWWGGGAAREDAKKTKAGKISKQGGWEEKESPGGKVTKLEKVEVIGEGERTKS